MYNPVFTRRFEKQLKTIPKKEQIKILEEISESLEDPRKFAIQLETTRPPIYRLRVGEYRIFFVLDNSLQIMKITDVIRRTSQTYR